MKPQISIRLTITQDVPELCSLLNAIIQIGGTTAIETLLTDAEFADYFIAGNDYVSCFTAVDTDGRLAGFQALERSTKLPEGWADIATFSRMQPKTPGVGPLLFAATREYALQSGIIALNATIRADNTGGLKYYDKMGFQTYAVKKSVPMSDGKLVDRILKRYDVI